MTVPEAAVHEDDDSPSGEDRVRLSPKVLAVQAVSDPEVAEGVPDRQFRGRVLPPHAPHER